MSRRYLLFLYSTPNLVGSIFGLIGLGLFFSGIIKAYWFFIVLGLYGIGFLITPKNKAQHLIYSKELSSKELQKELEQLIKKIKKSVQKPVLEKIENIKDNINILLPHIGKMESSEYDLHIVKQTITRYLPELLEAYLELPTAFARIHKVRNGQTPQQILIDQLDILDNRIEQIVVDVHQKNTEALIAHGQFLKNKFTEVDDWLV